jgi:hypothetical protein
MEVAMKARSMLRLAAVLVAAAAVGSVIASAQETTVDGAAAAIRKVISGKTCTGEDVLVFRESGTFERKGRPNATYNVGYGTILIRRGDDLRGHVTSVSVSGNMLHMSTGSYRCGQ